MLSPVTGECSCGFPQVTKGVTKVRWDKHRGVYSCELCEPGLADEDNDDPDSVRSIRLRVIGKRFSNPEETWSVYACELDGAQTSTNLPEGTKKPFSLTGNTGTLERGDIVSALGRFATNPKHGLSFEIASRPILALTESETALKSWLTRLKGVQGIPLGQPLAEKIIRGFGGLKNTIEVLDAGGKDSLTSLSNETTAELILTAYSSFVGYKVLGAFAATIGLEDIILSQLIDEYGDDAKKNLEENPYIIAELKGSSFEVADTVAKRLGIEEKDERRLAAIVINLLDEFIGDGHTYAPKNWFCDKKKAKGFTLSESELDTALTRLQQEREVVRKGQKLFKSAPIHVTENRVYSTPLWGSECGIAKYVKANATKQVAPLPIPLNPWGSMVPAKEQEEALKLACEKKICIITGGPGVGKSAAQKAILHAFDRAKLQTVLCAPTGMAAIKLGEFADREASTIHRLIGLNVKSKKDSSSVPMTELTCDAVIVDEISMVDVELFSALLQSLPEKARVILVGDVDQLPSCGPGQVLGDLIESRSVPVIRLTKIFRQKETARIPLVCRSINQGEMFDLAIKGTDTVFVPRESPKEIQDFILEASTKLLPEKYGYSPTDIQVIAPQHGENNKPNWDVGVKSLNISLQEVLNPKLDAEIYIGGGYLGRPGDRVIHTKNDYDLDVMNGEQGKILRASWKPFAALDGWCISAKGKTKKSNLVLLVDYGDRLVGYTKSEARQVQLAYAITCHKSQGQGYKAVIVPVHTINSFMLTRSLIYTAASRASEYLLFVGQVKAIENAIRNTRTSERLTSLKERLQ